MSVIPLCFLGVVSSMGNSYFLEQANHMEKKIIGPLKVPTCYTPRVLLPCTICIAQIILLHRRLLHITLLSMRKTVVSPYWNRPVIDICITMLHYRFKNGESEIR
ncbi:hypothetical protein L484_009851 [Morus notabilis]|uniref:Uncharacterized protein n=1 Tax=Morus notabilis TaxID=981085 RepID=W9QWZ3_9ROSA|nr:hypothetical protein L484_009851 [Morus notabilis]